MASKITENPGHSRITENPGYSPSVWRQFRRAKKYGERQDAESRILVEALRVKREAMRKPVPEEAGTSQKTFADFTK